MKKSTMRIFSFILVILLVVICGCKKSSTESKNSPPVVNSITISPTSVPANGLVSVTVAVSDPDLESLTINISVEDGTLVGSEKTRLWIAPSTAGTYILTVAVSDKSGGETTDTATLTVTVPITQITGIAKLEDGVNGNLDGSVARLFDSEDNFDIINYIKRIDALTVGDLAYFTFTDINPGSYFVEIIKDNNINNNLQINTGDYWGVHGSAEHPFGIELTEIQISEGQTVMCDIIVYEVTVGNAKIN